MYGFYFYLIWDVSGVKKIDNTLDGNNIKQNYIFFYTATEKYSNKPNYFFFSNKWF